MLKKERFEWGGGLQLFIPSHDSSSPLTCKYLIRCSYRVILHTAKPKARQRRRLVELIQNAPASQLNHKRFRLPPPLPRFLTCQSFLDPFHNHAEARNKISGNLQHTTWSPKYPPLPCKRAANEVFLNCLDVKLKRRRV